MHESSQLNLYLDGREEGGAERDLAFFRAQAELLEQLAHAAQFSGGIQVVEGPARSGKTFLVQALVERYLDACSELGVLAFESPAGLETCLSQVAETLGLPVTGDRSAEELLVALRRHVQDLQAEARVALLIIDNADFLDEAALAALASLLRTNAEVGFGLHLVLWGRPGLTRRLHTMQLADIVVQGFAVPLLSVRDVAQLLELWEAAGGEPDPVRVQALHEATGGCIGPLIDRVPIAQPNDSLAWLWSRALPVVNLPPAHLGGLALLLGVLTWILVSGGQADTRRGEDPLDVRNAGSDATGTRPAISAEPTTAPDLALEPVVNEDELRQALYGGKNDAPAKGEVGAKSLPAKAALRAEPEPIQPSPTEPASLDARELLAFNPDSYSLQIMAAASRESLEVFRRAQPNRQNLYLYRTRRQGDDWYVLLVGNYSSRRAAKDAMTSLPPAQRSAGAWPRKLHSIQEEIGEDD